MLVSTTNSQRSELEILRKRTIEFSSTIVLHQGEMEHLSTVLFFFI